MTLRRILLIPSSEVRPIQHFSYRTCRQVAGTKFLLWVLFLSWWWVPTILVVAFFYYTIKYSIPVFVALVGLVKEVKNGSGNHRGV